MLNIFYTTSFKKDYKRSKKRGKNLDILNKVLYDLSHNIPLDPKYRDHSLIGNYKGRRECHLQPDWLLIYEIDGENLVLHRTGTHSELF